MFKYKLVGTSNYEVRRSNTLRGIRKHILKHSSSRGNLS